MTNSYLYMPNPNFTLYIKLFFLSCIWVALVDFKSRFLHLSNTIHNLGMNYSSQFSVIKPRLYKNHFSNLKSQNNDTSGIIRDQNV